MKQSLPKEFYDNMQKRFHDSHGKKKTRRENKENIQKTDLDKYFTKRQSFVNGHRELTEDCLICGIKAINIVFMNCGHSICCEPCYLNKYQKDKCEICKFPIETVYRTMMKRESKQKTNYPSFPNTKPNRKDSHLLQTNGMHSGSSVNKIIDESNPNTNTLTSTLSMNQMHTIQDNLTNVPDDSFNSVGSGFTNSRVSSRLDEENEEGSINETFSSDMEMLVPFN